MPTVVVGVLAAPLLTERTFGSDWPDHLWLVWQQSQSITQLGHPSYFMQVMEGQVRGVFEPFFAFYGGTFYSVVGGLAALVGGHPTWAYIAVIVGAFAGAYAGWTWLARQAGLRGWWAQIPGLMYVTSPYIITDPFGRGDVPEFVATAAIPLVAASALAVLRGERVRASSAVMLVLSVTWLTGTHNISALWGTTFLVASAIVLLVAIGGARREIRPRRIRAVVGLAALGAGANAWFLLPTLAYAPATALAKSATNLGVFSLDSLGNVFSPLRNAPETVFAARNSGGFLDTAGRLNVEMPVLVFAWALAVLALARRRLVGPWRRYAVGMLVIVVGLLALILTNMSTVPAPWREIQFPYRAQTYVTLGVCALALGAIVVLPRIAGRRPRAVAVGALVLVSAASFGQAVVQQWSQASSFSKRKSIFVPTGQEPASWYAGFDYADASQPVVETHGQSVPPVEVIGHSDVGGVTFVSPGHVPMTTDVYGGPGLVKVTGARAVGRTSSDQMVIVPSAAKGKQTRVSFSTTHTLPLVLGVLITVVTLVIWLLLGSLATLRWARNRGLFARRLVGSDEPCPGERGDAPPPARVRGLLRPRR